MSATPFDDRATRSVTGTWISCARTCPHATIPRTTPHSQRMLESIARRRLGQHLPSVRCDSSPSAPIFGATQRRIVRRARFSRFLSVNLPWQRVRNRSRRCSMFVRIGRVLNKLPVVYEFLQNAHKFRKLVSANAPHLFPNALGGDWRRSDGGDGLSNECFRDWVHVGRLSTIAESKPLAMGVQPSGRGFGRPLRQESPAADGPRTFARRCGHGPQATPPDAGCSEVVRRHR